MVNSIIGIIGAFLLAAIGGLIKAFSDIQVLKKELSIYKDDFHHHEISNEKTNDNLYKKLDEISEKLNILIGENKK